MNTPTRSNPPSVLAAFKFYNIDLSSCQDFFYSLPSNTLHESRLTASDACLGGTLLSLTIELTNSSLPFNKPPPDLGYFSLPVSLLSANNLWSYPDLFKKEAKERAWRLCVKHRWLKKYTNEITRVLVWKYPHICMVNPGDGKICEKTYLCYYFACHLL